MATACAQCGCVLERVQCGQSCNETWVARVAGWYKVKKSKNWYCLACVLANQWEGAPPSADEKQQHLCNVCLQHATTMYGTVKANYNQPASSSSSLHTGTPSAAAHGGAPYTGPVSKAMLAEPDSNVHFMKPLATVANAYNQFALRYLLEKCGCSLEELNKRAKDKNSYKAGARGLPLHTSPWAVKRRDVLDESTGELRTVLQVPGLVASDEVYPSKQDFTNKWELRLTDIFVGEGRQSDGGSSAAVAEKHWRFDILEQLLKFNDLQNRPLPSALENMTLFQWNAGGSRQRLEPGALTGGSLHFGSMQEADDDIAASLRRWGAIVHQQQTNAAPATLTFARADFVAHSELIFANVLTRPYSHKGQVVDSWLLSFSIAKYDFGIEIAGRSSLTMASAHLNNEWAKKRDVAKEAIANLLETCHAYGVDVIGCDMNQGVALRKSHLTSPLFEAIKEFSNNHGVVSAESYETLYGQAPGDCCGFILLPTSALLNQCLIHKHGWLPFVSSDVGLRATDRDSHYPCHLWLRNVSRERTYKRSAEGWAHVQAKKQHKKEVLQAKKKAQKNIGAIRAWVETFKEVSPRKGVGGTLSLVAVAA